MWNKIENISPAVVGQSIFKFLDIKNIVRLETALANHENIVTFSSFVSNYSKPDIEIHIPEEISKLKWLQKHNLQIKRTIVHIEELNEIFPTEMINEIELKDSNCHITSKGFNYFPHSCYQKVVSVCFDKNRSQHMSIMNKLFSLLPNLRELKIIARPEEEWLLNALQILSKTTNNNILIEKFIICPLHYYEGSIKEIIKYFPKLLTFEINFNICEDSLIELSKHCPLLQEFTCGCIPKIISYTTLDLCKHTLSCIYNITTPVIFHDSDFEDYSIDSDDSDDDINNYTITIPYLINLQKVEFNSNEDFIFMPLISKYCLKLEYIQINKDSTAIPIQLLQLLQTCLYIKSIILLNDIYHTDDVIINIAEHCSNLQILTINSDYNNNTVSNISLLALSKHCLFLKEIDLSSCKNTTETGIVQLIQQCKSLNILKLNPYAIFEYSDLGFPVDVDIYNNYTIYTLIR